MPEAVTLRDLKLEADDEDAVAALKLVVILVADGNATRFARTIQKTPQAVRKWFARGRVPAEEVLALEALTEGRVSRHALRPDLYPEHDPRLRYLEKWRAAEPMLEARKRPAA